MDRIAVSDSDWGWGVNEEHRTWGPTPLPPQAVPSLILPWVEAGWGSGGEEESSMSFSAEGQEPNQLLSNQMHHKWPYSQRTKYWKRQGGSGEAPLGLAHSDCHTGL